MITFCYMHMDWSVWHAGLHLWIFVYRFISMRPFQCISVTISFSLSNPITHLPHHVVAVGLLLVVERRRGGCERGELATHDAHIHTVITRVWRSDIIFMLLQSFYRGQSDVLGVLYLRCFFFFFYRNHSSTNTDILWSHGVSWSATQMWITDERKPQRKTRKSFKLLFFSESFHFMRSWALVALQHSVISEFTSPLNVFHCAITKSRWMMVAKNEMFLTLSGFSRAAVQSRNGLKL